MERLATEKEKMSAGPGQSADMEEEEFIVRRKEVKKPRCILDSSDDSAGPGQISDLEEEEIIVKRKGLKKPRGILDS